MKRTPRAAAAVAALLSVSLIAAACGGDDDSADTTLAPTTTAGETPTTAAPAGGTITYAAEQDFTTYNNNTSDGTLFANSLVLNQVLPSVSLFDDKGEYVWTDLVEGEPELQSEDPQVVVYKLNPDAKWSDGEPVDFDDFYLHWIAQNGKLVTGEKDEEGNDIPMFDAASTTGYEDIEKVEASDDGKTITVTYAKKYADWKALFGALMPAHVAEKAAGVADVTTASEEDLKKVAEVWNTAWTADKFSKETYLSAGPYTFESITPGENVTLVRNENYWGEPGQADSIVFRLIDDATAQPQALANKEVQIITPQPNPDLLAQVKGISGVVAEVYSGFIYEHWDFNFADPLFQDKAVREAFALCLPREEIVEKLIKPLKPDAEVLNNRFFIPVEADYQDNSGPYGKQDIDGAKAKLEAAGWTLNAQNVYEKDGKQLAFKITYRSPNPRREQQIQLTQAACAKAGMKIDADPDPETFSKRLPEGSHQLVVFAWVGSPLKSPSKSIFETGGGQNYGKYSNPKVDELLSQLAQELDTAKQFELSNEIDKILWEDLATIPVFQFPDLVAHADNVENVIYNPTQAGITWNAEQWVLK